MPRKPRLSVQKISDLLKNLEFLNDSGNFRPLSENVWQEASNLLNNEMNNKYIYLYITQNRNGILEKLLTKEDLDQINSPAKQLNDSVHSNWSLTANVVLPPLRTQFTLPRSVWNQIQSEIRSYAGRQYEILKMGWADVLYEQLWEHLKLPCPFALKNGNVNQNQGAIFLQIHGKCTECGNEINLYSLAGPNDEGLPMQVSTYNTRDVTHKNKRTLKGTKRKAVVKELHGSSTYCWRREKANQAMDFGDQEPADLYSEDVLRKAKQLDNDAKLGVRGTTDPIAAIMNLKYGLEFSGCFREIGIDKFFAMYWSPDQLYMYKKVSKTNSIRSISIDATGSLVAPLVKPDGSKHVVFVYQAVTAVNNKVMPIFQMVSEKHDANILSYWMREWLRSDVPCPNQVVTDYSLALLNAASLAFNSTDLGSYVEQCLHGLMSPSETAVPPCILRIDIAHLIKSVCRWKCFKKTPHCVKDFFVRCVGLLANCKNIEDFCTICTDVLSVSFSDTEDITDAQDHCFSAQQRLFHKIRIIEQPMIDLDKDTESNDFEKDEALEITHTGGTLQKILNKLECDSVKSGSGDRPNPFWCPEFGRSLLRLSKHFVLWSGIMAADIATSARSEEYFREMKMYVAKGAKSIRVDKFLITHLRSISGTMKLLNAPSAAVELTSFNESDRTSSPKMRKKKFSYSTKAKNLSEIQRDDIQNGTNDESLPEDDKECQESSPKTMKSMSMSLDTTFADESSNYEVTLTEISDEDSFRVNEDATERNTLLNEVESWKGLNKPPKQRGKYLTACPNIVNNVQKPVFNKPIVVLQNGSALAPIKVGQQFLKLIYTCPFDSIVQSMLSAYRDWVNYNTYLENLNNPLAKFIRMLSVTGITQKVYAERAAIMIDIVKPDRGVLDCHYNVSSLLSLHLLKNEASYKCHEQCAACGHEETRVSPVTEVSPMPFYTNGMRGLQTAINDCCKIANPRCRRCSGPVDSQFDGGSHLFVDLECLEWTELAERLGFPHWTAMFTLSEVPEELVFCDKRYQLVSAITYIPGAVKHKAKSIGHYIAYLKRISGKWEIHNDICSDRKPQAVSMRVLLQKTNIHLLFYVKTD